VQQSIEKPSAPGSCCHVDTSSGAQEGLIVQGFADGHIAVIGHDSEESIPSGDEEEKAKNLGSTFRIGDASGVPKGVGHGFG